MWSSPAVAALICTCIVACLPEFEPDLGASAADGALCGEQGAPCCEAPLPACSDPELLCDPDNQRCLRPSVLSCGSDDECRPGEVCCDTGFVDTCWRGPKESCPEIDLVALSPQLDDDPVDLRFFDETSDSDRCLVERGCVGGYGWRRLLGVSTVVTNVGRADLLLGSPDDAPEATINLCDGEPRFKSFLRYELLDSTGTKARQDIAAACSPPASSAFITPFDCDYQGLWSDFSQQYPSSLAEGGRADDCRWIDITELLPGEYTLRVTVNPDNDPPERNVVNNIPPALPILLPAFEPAARCLEPLNPLLGRFEERECGWVRAPFQADGQATPCTPGSDVLHSCTSDDPEVLCGDYRVCPGPDLCAFEESIRPSFDPGCFDLFQPNLYLLCPPTGQYSLWLPGDVPNGFSCEPYVDPYSVLLAPPPDAGAPPEP